MEKNTKNVLTKLWYRNYTCSELYNLKSYKKGVISALKKRMNKKFISKSNRVLRKVLNSKDNLDIIQDFIETFIEIEVEEIKLNPYLESKSNYLPLEENFGIANVGVK